MKITVEQKFEGNQEVSGGKFWEERTADKGTEGEIILRNTLQRTTRRRLDPHPARAET